MYEQSRGINETKFSKGFRRRRETSIDYKTDRIAQETLQAERAIRSLRKREERARAVDQRTGYDPISWRPKREVQENHAYCPGRKHNSKALCSTVFAEVPPLQAPLEDVRKCEFACPNGPKYGPLDRGSRAQRIATEGLFETHKNGSVKETLTQSYDGYALPRPATSIRGSRGESRASQSSQGSTPCPSVVVPSPSPGSASTSGQRPSSAPFSQPSTASRISSRLVSQVHQRMSSSSSSQPNARGGRGSRPPSRPLW